MAQFNKKSSEDINKQNSKNSEEKTFPTKRINSTLNFIERRKEGSAKSPPNPFMSRINISSFLNLMVSDKSDSSFKNKSTNSKSYINIQNKHRRENSFNTSIKKYDLDGDDSTFNTVINNQCPVCANELSTSLMFNYTDCNHYACIDCWQSYVINRIENYEIAFGFSCLTCSSELPYHKVIDIIRQTNDLEYSKRLIQRLENFLLERALKQDQNFRRCPNPGCDFAFLLVHDYSGCKELNKCQLRPGCKGQICGNSRCVKFWNEEAFHDCKHKPQTISVRANVASTSSNHNDINAIQEADDDIRYPKQKNLEYITSTKKQSWWSSCLPFRRNRKNKSKGKLKGSHKVNKDLNENTGTDNSPSKIPMTINDDNISDGSYKSCSSRNKIHKSSEQIQVDGEIKSCPKCHTYVLKMNDGSCNHMVCVICGCEFCWLCMRQITDMHYLSPSGCTFWGRRQWNVEKRTLWQLGTLIGAPIAIGFLAALAIPAMVIGIPLYVGRKIHGALKTKNKDEKRTVAVLGGIGAFILSPVIAAITVGLGVPLMLAYVYVVMPIALCRASACSCDDNSPIHEEVNFSEDLAPNTNIESDNGFQPQNPPSYKLLAQQPTSSDIPSNSTHPITVHLEPQLHNESDSDIDNLGGSHDKVTVANLFKTKNQSNESIYDDNFMVLDLKYECQQDERSLYALARFENVLIGDRIVSQSAVELHNLNNNLINRNKFHQSATNNMSINNTPVSTAATSSNPSNLMTNNTTINDFPDSTNFTRLPCNDNY